MAGHGTDACGGGPGGATGEPLWPRALRRHDGVCHQWVTRAEQSATRGALTLTPIPLADVDSAPLIYTLRQSHRRMLLLKRASPTRRGCARKGPADV
jgi:hypothetical protein